MDTSNLNHLWADLIVEELVRNGVDFFCLAPGSRSTPLTTAVARNPRARHTMHFDERGTAYRALGYARATGRPAAWVTTSGTAVANGLPAVVEAASDGVPMLLLTADRPPELRDTGANQTIDQVDLFGGYARWAFDVPAPTTAVEPQAVLTTVDQAVYRACRAPRGPVHLNCMFREPLAPDPEGDYAAYAAGLDAWRARRDAYTRYAGGSPGVDEETLDRVASKLRGLERGIVVAGRLDSPAQGDAVRWLAEAIGWPLLPDVGAQIRLGAQVAPDPRIVHHDALLESPAFRAEHAPEAVLHVGGRSTARGVERLVAELRPDPYVVVQETPFRLDPNHRVTDRVEADVVTFCERLIGRLGTQRAQGAGAWTEAWRAADARAASALAERLDGREELTEPGAARLVSRHAPAGSGIVVASSMPVRDLDRFGVADGAAVRVAANRGASGIDGTVATAVGFAEGLRAPVTLLVGDLAMLHDLNSLAMLRDRAAAVVVVVLNNHGGGIFSFLPIARHEAVFEPYFGTPHDLDFGAAAELFGLAYHRPQTTAAFVEAYGEALASGRPALLEVTTDRAENHALHRELAERVRAAVEGA